MTIQGGTAVAVVFMLAVLALKVTAFVLGYLIVRLGHDTLIKGVTGEVDFGFSAGRINTKLKSASPGAFFVLAGAAIIVWGLTVEKPFKLVSPGLSSQLEQQDQPEVKALDDRIPEPPPGVV